MRHLACALAMASCSGLVLAQPVEWTQRLGSVPGGSSRNTRMIYDAARGVSVLFGGNAPENHGINDQTWEWDGSVWARRLVSGPPARQNHAMVYDSSRRIVVLFGGNGDTDTTIFRGDTWEWDGTEWTQRVVAGPSPRFWHAMAYDAARGVTVLFGGWTGQYNGETWEWNGTAWTQRLVSGPAARYQHAMTFDTVRGVTVLFGGSGTAPSGDTETWEWNGTVWTQRVVAGPSGRAQHAMVYDPERAGL